MSDVTAERILQLEQRIARLEKARTAAAKRAATKRQRLQAEIEARGTEDVAIRRAREILRKVAR